MRSSKYAQTLDADRTGRIPYFGVHVLSLFIAGKWPPVEVFAHQEIFQHQSRGRLIVPRGAVLYSRDLPTRKRTRWTREIEEKKQWWEHFWAECWSAWEDAASGSRRQSKTSLVTSSRGHRCWKDTGQEIRPIRVFLSQERVETQIEHDVALPHIDEYFRKSTPGERVFSDIDANGVVPLSLSETRGGEAMSPKFHVNMKMLVTEVMLMGEDQCNIVRRAEVAAPASNIGESATPARLRPDGAQVDFEKRPQTMTIYGFRRPRSPVTNIRKWYCVSHMSVEQSVLLTSAQHRSSA